MLLCNSLVFCPAIRKPKNLLCSDHNRKSKIQSLVTNKHVSYKARASFNVTTKSTNDDLQGKGGVGIVNFFQGKNIFITGGTGLLGKALVEKLLRSTPVGKIYILVKADDHETGIDRMTKELINSELFKCLQEKHGKYYQEFMTENLVPVIGNITEPNLGMDSDSAHAIMKDVHVIIESAANTNMNERYDVSLETNVNGPRRIMSFAKACKSLELLVHISTAYVNGEREGILLENPLTMGENRRKDPSPFPRVDISDEVNLASRSGPDGNKDMRKLGMERANFYGWHNTYQITKAMGEMIIHETRGDMPVVIIRPTIIESCYKGPVPGWIQGNRVFDPIICSFGKGQLPAFLCKPDTPVDIIPLDMVVNTTIAAIAKHGYKHMPELSIYQIATSVLNPIRVSDMFDYTCEYFRSRPLIESESSSGIISYYDNLAPVKYFDNFDDLSKYTRDEIYRRFGSMRNIETHELQKQCKAKIMYAENLCKIYEFAGFLKARFDAGNTQKLLSEMSKEEQINFDIDVTKIDWRNYITEVHIPGLIKFVLKQEGKFV
ncbi:hypothetical protein ABFS83_07G084700 [Erythranthe nasuta]